MYFSDTKERKHISRTILWPPLTFIERFLLKAHDGFTTLL